MVHLKYSKVFVALSSSSFFFCFFSFLFHCSCFPHVCYDDDDGLGMKHSSSIYTTIVQHQWLCETTKDTEKHRRVVKCIWIALRKAKEKIQQTSTVPCEIRSESTDMDINHFSRLLAARFSSKCVSLWREFSKINRERERMYICAHVHSKWALLCSRWTALPLTLSQALPFPSAHTLFPSDELFCWKNRTWNAANTNKELETNVIRIGQCEWRKTGRNGL